MAKQIIINEIRRLSQEEGLKDGEIAKILGYHRATINEIRKDAGIPTANLDNRRDKSYICAKCGKQVMIRRWEPKKALCEDCERIFE